MNFWANSIFRKIKNNKNCNFRIRNYKLVEHENMHASKVFKGEMGYLGSYGNQKPPYDTKNPFMADLTVNYNLCSEESDRIVFHCEVDVSKARIKLVTYFKLFLI